MTSNQLSVSLRLLSEMYQEEAFGCVNRFVWMVRCLVLLSRSVFKCPAWRFQRHQWNAVTVQKQSALYRRSILLNVELVQPCERCWIKNNTLRIAKDKHLHWLRSQQTTVVPTAAATFSFSWIWLKRKQTPNASTEYTSTCMFVHRRVHSLQTGDNWNNLLFWGKRSF